MEWGSIILQLNVKYRRSLHDSSSSDGYVFPTLTPIQVNSQWRKEQAAVSISQEIEVSVHDMHSDSISLLLNDIEYIDVVIRMCTHTGKKFKILSLSCC